LADGNGFHRAHQLRRDPVVRKPGGREHGVHHLAVERSGIAEMLLELNSTLDAVRGDSSVRALEEAFVVLLDRAGHGLFQRLLLRLVDRGLAAGAAERKRATGSNDELALAAAD